MAMCSFPSYISVYIYLQHEIEDYEETSAALLTLVFAVLHLIRTFMGVWQLQMFKKWTISSIKHMESLGYETRLLNNSIEHAVQGDSDDEDSSDLVEEV